MKEKFFVSPEGEQQDHLYHTKLEEKLVNVPSPFEKFTQSQMFPGLLLIFSTGMALVMANSTTYSQYYYTIINATFGFTINHTHLALPVKFWVNHVCMAIFFFFVGLEIKREFIVGDLLDSKKAMLVIFTAVGGVILPALTFFICNINTPQVLHGWAIPIATDTAFALGILACFKKILPKTLFNFVAAVAILDDIIAILIIACFYTGRFQVEYMLYALGCYTVILILNIVGARQLWLYLLFGLVMGFYIEYAGVHSTLTGILVALALPARPAKGPNYVIGKVKSLISRFEKRKIENPLVLEDPKQHEILTTVKETVVQATTPLQYWKDALEAPVALLILPCFAFVNAGLHLADMSQLFYPVSFAFGIGLGLVVAKPLGFFISANLTARFFKIALPVGMNRVYLAIAAILSGIGFTMSLLIASLSFSEKALINTAKLSVLCASLLMIVLSLAFLLVYSCKLKKI